MVFLLVFIFFSLGIFDSNSPINILLLSVLFYTAIINISMLFQKHLYSVICVFLILYFSVSSYYTQTNSNVFFIINFVLIKSVYTVFIPLLQQFLIIYEKRSSNPSNFASLLHFQWRHQIFISLLMDNYMETDL